MGLSASKHARMERTPDEKREILRKFIAERGLKSGTWAKASGVSQNSIYNFLNGESQALDLRTYAKLARTANVPVWKISGDEPELPSPTSVWVTGYVQAGLFRNAIEWDASDWYSVDVPIDARFRSKARALEVRGTSMNLEFRDGSVVIWVEMLDVRAPRNGDLVIVYAYKGGDIEATVKELRVVDGRSWLWPKSDDPAFQQPIDPNDPPDGVETIEIKGLVIGDFRARHI